MPTLWGPTTVRVSETMFCGMQVDGAMNPYRLRWSWTMDADDPRLSPSGRQTSDRGLAETVLRAL